MTRTCTKFIIKLKYKMEHFKNRLSYYICKFGARQIKVSDTLRSEKDDL